MEYGATTDSVPAVVDANAVKTNSNHGHMRIQSDPADISILSEQVTLPFSGRVAKNRFLKAPMTERLCSWNAPSEPDITTRGVPTPAYTHLYERWGEGGIGIIVSGNTMVKYDAVEAFGNPILCDDHDGRVGKYAEVVKGAKKEGSLIVAQLSHPGRQGNRYCKYC